tara:strand:- start:142 stop:318 length:177 start_codon:yes stop_codon:yes gene_type:complete
MKDRNTAFIADLRDLLRKLEREKYTGNFIVNINNGVVSFRLKENTVIDLEKLRKSGAI